MEQAIRDAFLFLIPHYMSFLNTSETLSQKVFQIFLSLKVRITVTKETFNKIKWEIKSRIERMLSLKCSALWIWKVDAKKRRSKTDWGFRNVVVAKFENCQVVGTVKELSGVEEARWIMLDVIKSRKRTNRLGHCLKRRRLLTDTNESAVNGKNGNERRWFEVIEGIKENGKYADRWSVATTKPD